MPPRLYGRDFVFCFEKGGLVFDPCRGMSNIESRPYKGNNVGLPSAGLPFGNISVFRCHGRTQWTVVVQNRLHRSVLGTSSSIYYI